MRITNNNINFLNELEYPTGEYKRGGMPRLDSLDEATLNRIVGRHDKVGYAIVSACRQYIYKNGTPVLVDEMDSVSDEEILSGASLRAENNKRTIALRNAIKNANYSYLPVYGGFKEIGSENPAEYEKSFIIFNYDRKGTPRDIDELCDFAIECGKEFYQDSVLIKKPGEAPYYVTTNIEGKIGQRDTDIVFSGEYTLNDITQAYFTALKKINKSDDEINGKVQRFTFEGVYLNPSPVGVQAKTKRHLINEIFI